MITPYIKDHLFILNPPDFKLSTFSNSPKKNRGNIFYKKKFAAKLKKLLLHGQIFTYQIIQIYRYGK